MLILEKILAVKFLFTVLFYRRFRHCITALQAMQASGKAQTPKIRGVSIGSLREGATRYSQSGEQAVLATWAEGSRRSRVRESALL